METATKRHSEHVGWMIKEIGKRKTHYYQMANPELAEACFPEIQKVFPEVKMFTMKPYYQFFTVTKRAENRLKADLLKRKVVFLDKISEIDTIIATLDS